MSVAQVRTCGNKFPQDKGWAWVVLLGAFITFYIEGGIMKTMGLFFVELLDEFDTPSSVTSWVATLAFTMMMLGGALGSGLATRFGLRPVSLSGGLFMLVGLSSNYFATHFGHVILANGVLMGLGAGILFSSGLTSVACHFNRRRAVGNAVTVAGASIGQLTLPPVMRYLIDEVGLRGAFLILGGFSLNACASSLLFRPEKFWEKKSKHYSKKKECNDVSISEVKPHNDDSHVMKDDSHVMKDANLELYECSKSLEDVGGKVEHFRQRAGTYSCGPPVDSTISQNSHHDKKHKQFGNLLRADDKHGVVFGSADTLILALPSLQKLPKSENEKKYISQKPPNNKTVETRDCCRGLMSQIGIMYDLTLLANPVFLIIATSFLFGQFSVQSQTLFLPAKAEEIRISRDEAALLLSVAAIGELFGRIVCGIVLHFRLIKSYHMMAVFTLGNGAASIYCPFAADYAGMVVFALCLGVFGGAFFGMVANLIMDMLGVDRLPQALGLVMFFTIAGLLALPVQGWLKDVTGTYAYSYYIAGALCITISGLQLLAPFAQRYMARKEEELLSKKEKTMLGNEC